MEKADFQCAKAERWAQLRFIIGSGFMVAFFALTWGNYSGLESRIQGKFRNEIAYTQSVCEETKQNVSAIETKITENNKALKKYFHEINHFNATFLSKTFGKKYEKWKPNAP